jgi:RNA polymerase sigma-70 factor, ECF subfamily
MSDFHALYESYAPHVRRFALFLCGDQALADDITSETFVRAWTAPGPVRQETVKAYLFTIARNLYRDHLCRSRRHTALENAMPDDRASAPRQAEARSELRFVLTVMQELPEVDRAALLMRAQDELSYEEISRALGLSVAAVKVKIHRARLKLMKATKTRNEKGCGPEADS